MGADAGGLYIVSLATGVTLEGTAEQLGDVTVDGAGTTIITGDIPGNYYIDLTYISTALHFGADAVAMGDNLTVMLNAASITGTTLALTGTDGSATLQVFGTDGNDTIDLAGVTATDVLVQVIGGAGADAITVGTGIFKLNQDWSDVGESGTFESPSINSISTSNFDVITGLTEDDTIWLGSYTTAGTTVVIAPAVTTLANIVLLNGKVQFVKGSYNGDTHLFVGDEIGTDALMIYDAQESSTAEAYEAVVLVGGRSLASNTVYGIDGIVSFLSPGP